MALPLGLLIANILGMSGAAWLAGKAERERGEKVESERWQRQVMKEALFKGIFEQGTLPPRPALIEMLGGGSQATQMADMLGQIVAAQHNQRVNNMATAQRFMNQFNQGMAPGGVPNYFPASGREGVEDLDPAQQLAFGHLMARPPQGQAALPPGPQVAQAPAPGGPPEGGAGAALVEEPPGAAPAAPTPQVLPPAMRPRPPFAPPAARAIGRREMKLDPVTGALKLEVTAPTQEERLKEARIDILSQAQQGLVSPAEMARVLRERVGHVDEKELQAYVDYHFQVHYPGYLERAMKVPYGQGVPSPFHIKAAAAAYAADHLHAPSKDVLEIMGSQDGIDAWFREKVREFPEQSVRQVRDTFVKYAGGAAPSPQVLLEELAQEKARLAAQLQQDDPVRSQNRAWVLNEMRKKGVELTAEESQAASAFAPAAAAAQAVDVEHGRLPTQMHTLTPGGAPAPAPVVPAPAPVPPPAGTPVPPPITPPAAGAAAPAAPTVPGESQAARASRLAREREVKLQEEKSRAEAIGGGLGRIAVAPHEMVSDRKVLDYIYDTKTGKTIAPETRGEIDRKLRAGEYAQAHVTPEVLMGFQVFKDQLNNYGTVVERPNGVYSLPAWKRPLLRAAAAPFSVEAFGFPILTEMPPLTFLRKLNMTPQQIEDMNAIVNNNRTSVAHLRALDEKGQGMSSRIYQLGADAFPNPWDDRVSARGKLKALHGIVDIRLDRSIVVSGGPPPSQPVRIKVTLPDGTPQWWNGQGTLPPGTTMGWR